MPRGRKKAVEAPAVVSNEVLEIDNKIKELEGNIRDLKVERKAAIKRASAARKAESKKLVEAFMKSGKSLDEFLGEQQ